VDLSLVRVDLQPALASQALDGVSLRFDDDSGLQVVARTHPYDDELLTVELDDPASAHSQFVLDVLVDAGQEDVGGIAGTKDLDAGLGFQDELLGAQR